MSNFSNSKNCKTNQNIYEILGIQESREMYLKAHIVSSIIAKMEQNKTSLKYAAGKAKITRKQLESILSGGFHNTSLFRLKRIAHQI
jgi:predicted XRE-type DNA-binding protein